ncbi:MAG: sn-glycerol-3-phosphate ABC transporter ATP-binding protein UgpC [Clostridia bacterium]|nr:sn-glycerol-3-phosphate ABC transporter ATP-binding protein UgpC [Clostridia bacterium]
MAGLSLKHIYKVYPNGTKAVSDFNMEIADKEFIVFVGPSGCGKSTTLRMIAGLEDISAGELTIGENVVNDMEPKDRDIAMVFQNYALYPHMTVFENIAFGLRLRKLPKDEINRRVTEAAEILGITEYLSKKPKEMSGGQRQRVSLGRAIVREPKVMLLDEPLSNLDAKLRTQMRSEIAKLHAKLQTTFIYVTHDQIEAMTMGTRIVVMKDGFVQQIDTPKNLYDYPGNKFVAGFIGTPQMNFFEGTLLKKGDNVEINFEYSEAKVTVPYSMMYKAKPSYLDGKKKVYIGLRAEAVSVNPAVVKASKSVIKVRVSHKEELGNQTLIYGDINMQGDGYTESSTRIIINADVAVDFKSGDIIDAALDINKVHLFDEESEVSILPRIPEYNYVDCTVKDGALSFLGVELKMPSAINCPDGKYDLLIPTDAITVKGKDADITVVANENINGVNLLSFELGGRRMFAVTDEEVKKGKAKIAIDWKKISILSADGTVVEAMPSVMTFEGRLLKEKVVEEVTEKDKTKKKKVIKFFLEISGYKTACPDKIADKLITAIGVKHAFGEKLLFECGPYDLKIAEEGISAEAAETADYGREKFAVLKVGENTVYAYTEAQVSGSVNLLPEVDKLSIIQADKHIRIV